MLADLERKAERERSHVLTGFEAKVAEHQVLPIEQQVTDYLESLQTKGTTERQIRETRRILTTVFKSCGFRTLSDLDRDAFERHLNRRLKAGTGARTRNADREAIVVFSNWCVEHERLIANVFALVDKADEDADERRPRRAMTEAGLTRLLDIAQKRPLVDALVVRRGHRKGMHANKLSPEYRKRLELLGRERALIYKSLVTTDLRKSELASLTVGSLRFDGDFVYAHLDAAKEKNRTGSDIPLRADLVDEIQCWLAGKLDRAHEEACRNRTPIPAALPLRTPLFNVPTALVRNPGPRLEESRDSEA